MTKLLTKKEAAARVGWHPEHLMRLAREGNFPTPIKLADTLQGGVRFVESEVVDWIQKKLAERDHNTLIAKPPLKDSGNGTKNATLGDEI